MRLPLIAIVLVDPLLAHAEEPTVDAARSPGFVQIDRYDATSVAGGDLTYVSLDGIGEDVTVMRFQLGGRYVDPASQFGGYVNLPITYASGDGDSLTAIGNIELGGLMLPRIGDSSTAMVVHGGITLPTGSDGEDAFANLFGAFARPQDIYLALPKATTVRLGLSPMFRNGNVFGRADLGIDINLDVDGEGDEADPLMRLNVGVGVDLGSVAVMGELSNLYVFNDDEGDSIGDKMINVFALSARFNAGSAMPYASLLVPLDDDSSDVIDLALTLGVEARL
jgi:hypothetical protein